MMNFSRDILKVNHMMLDLETTSTKPTAQILEIAVIAFRLDEGKLDANTIDQYASVFHSRIKSDRVEFDTDTLTWWIGDDNRRALLQELLKDGNEELPVVLSRLNNFFREEKNSEAILWAWPTHFDIPILMNAYHESGAPLPATLSYPHTRRIMDVRTILNLLPSGWKSPSKGKRMMEAHSAIRDCCVQIESLQAMIADVLL